MVRGISVPNFVEIRDLSELSCMSLRSLECEPGSHHHVMTHTYMLRVRSLNLTGLVELNRFALFLFGLNVCIRGVVHNIT